MTLVAKKMGRQWEELELTGNENSSYGGELKLWAVSLTIYLFASIIYFCRNGTSQEYSDSDKTSAANTFRL